MIRINDKLYSITPKNNKLNFSFKILKESLALETITNAITVSNSIKFLNITKTYTDDVLKADIKEGDENNEPFLINSNSKHIVFYDINDNILVHKVSDNHKDIIYVKNYEINMFGSKFLLNNIVIATYNKKVKVEVEGNIIKYLSDFFDLELIATYPVLYDKDNYNLVDNVHFKTLFFNRNSVKPERYAFIYNHNKIYDDPFQLDNDLVYDSNLYLSPKNIINNKNPLYVYLNYIYICDCMVIMFYKTDNYSIYFKPDGFHKKYPLRIKGMTLAYYEICSSRLKTTSNLKSLNSYFVKCLPDSYIFNVIPKDLPLVRAYIGGENIDIND